MSDVVLAVSFFVLGFAVGASVIARNSRRPSTVEGLRGRLRSAWEDAASWEMANVTKAAEISRLRASLDKATRDSERLDWLNGRVSWFVQHHAFKPEYANIREAIDKAMSPSPRETPK